MEDNDGPYGKFLNPYGHLEESIINDFESLVDAFDFEIDEHTYRLLLCLKDKKDYPYKKEILDALKQYQFNDEKIINLINDLKDNW